MNKKTGRTILRSKPAAALIIAAAFFSFFTGGIPEPGASVPDEPAPAQTAPPRNVPGNGTGGTVAQPQSVPAGNPYYAGDGGRGKSIAVLVPSASGLAPEQNYLPVLIQGVLVTDMAKYSAMRILDRVSLDSVVAETESGIYQNEDDFIQFGKVANVGYAMSGSIVKTTTGYNLSIQITDTKTGTTTASYSGACTVTELDNHAGIKKASVKLLEQMEVRLTDRARGELASAGSREAINAQTALARGITSQKSGTTVEAMSYYYRAAAFDPSLLEASKRVSVMSASINSGNNIGEDVRREIQLRNKWRDIIQEASDYFIQRPPYKLVYGTDLIQGRINYEKETVDFRSEIYRINAPEYQILTDLKKGLSEAQGKKGWAIEGPYSTNDFNVHAALVNDAGKTLGTAQAVMNNWYPTGTFYFNGINANEISDNLKISIVSVNGKDMKTIQTQDYMTISAFNFSAIYDLGFEFEFRGSDRMFITKIDGNKFDGVLPEKIGPWTITGIDRQAFSRMRQLSNKEISSLTLPSYINNDGVIRFSEIANLTISPGVTFIGDEVFGGARGGNGNTFTTVVIPSTVTSIGRNAFAHNQLQSVTLSPGITKIGGRAFFGNKLRSVAIPQGVTEIESETFAGNQLESVVIPASVRSIADGAFADNQIKVITIGADVNMEITSFLRNNAESLGSDGRNFFHSYQQHGRKAGTYIIDASLINLGPNYVTQNSSKPAWSLNATGSVSFDNVNKINGAAETSNTTGANDIDTRALREMKEAFRNTRVISNLTIPPEWTTIEGGMFEGKGITSLTISSGVTSIGADAFYGNELESLVLPPSVRKIGLRAFFGNKIKTITIGADVEVDSMAFLQNNSDSYTASDIGNFARHYRNTGSKAGTYTYRSLPILGAHWFYTAAE